MKSIAVVFLGFLWVLSSCSPGSSSDLSSVSAPATSTAFLNPEELQTLPRDVHFQQLMTTLNFNTQGASWIYKTGGTSLGLSLKIAQKTIGKWLPKNSAADPESQVVAYRLGRYLQMSENVAPADYYTLKDQALYYFADQVQSREETNPLRQENRETILAALDNDSSKLFGAFTSAPSTYEVLEIQSSGSLNRRHPLAGFIRADGPMPSDSKHLSFASVRSSSGKNSSESELELARQLSKILVLDILMGQWDRWSGGNFEAGIADSGTRVYFIARDNGGATLSSRSSNRTQGLVSRFDRTQVSLLKKLVQQLRNPEQKNQIVALLKLRSNPKILEDRAAGLLSFIDQQVQQYGNSVFFP